MKTINKIHNTGNGYIKTEINIFKQKNSVIRYLNSSIRLLNNTIIITKLYENDVVIKVRIYNCNEKGYYNNEYPGNINNEFLNSIYDEIEKLMK